MLDGVGGRPGKPSPYTDALFVDNLSHLEVVKGNQQVGIPGIVRNGLFVRFTLGCGRSATSSMRCECGNR
jgi:hypothetical protein